MMGIAEVLTIVFVVLKLTNVITWSWWLVLLPAILSFSLYAIIGLVKLGMVLIAVVAVKRREKKAEL
ncbi:MULTISPECIES: transmembrane Fragile-X-F protein [Lysinibacillus]|nr:transmembrane Fragile-X-F protein [Lysinibacillus capsici]WNN78176.1 transmembrane Fragile-X-F protein [Lysinibacillus capsici]